MKKGILICSLVALSFCLAIPASAQKNVIKVNPLSVFLLTGSGAYERALTPNISAQIGGYYSGLTLDGDWLDGNAIGYKVWAVTPEVRFYPGMRKDAPRGFFIGPFARVRNANVQGQLDFTIPNTDVNIQEQGTVNVRSYGGGAVLGYQAVVLKHLSLEAFVGPGIYVSDVDVTTQGTVTSEVAAQLEEFNELTGGFTDGVNEGLQSFIPNYRGPDFNGVGVRAGVTIGIAF